MISIHALREEGDVGGDLIVAVGILFLSTPSARRATYDVRNPLKLRQISIHTLREEGDALYDEVGRFQSDFYPRPPRGGRQAGTSPPPNFSQFLSTPSARRATHKSRNPKGKVQFLSTPSARRATSGYGYGDGEGSGISIHALREEGDAGHRHPRLAVVISIHALREEGDRPASAYR